MSAYKTSRSIDRDDIDNYEVEEVFRLYSENKKKPFVQVSVLGDILRIMGLNPTELEIQRFSGQFSPDYEIGVDEFQSIFKTLSNNMEKRKNPSLEEIIEGFKPFDRDSNGLISATDMKMLLTSLGEKMIADEVDKLLRYEEDENGFINYESFVKNILNS